MAMRCGGCGLAVAHGARPFRCANAGGDDVDHVLVRDVPLSADPFFADETNPFIRYRRLTHGWYDAAARGISDGEFIDVVRRLTDRVEAVDGRPFTITRFEHRASLGAFVKDETSNVAGSHKSRHLMGVLIWLELMSRFDEELAHASLAIASCGNAALAAAVLARAAGRTLDVFVPGETAQEVIAPIEALGACVTRCERTAGVAGDPSVARFREAVAAGALPFTCQGNENGLTIEGASTLAWEMVSSGVRVERIFIQVGGGALASAVIAGVNDAVAIGLLPRLPRIHAVQTEGSPLARAWDRLQDRSVEEAIAQRSSFMTPRETVPVSIATGILDDETYDWAAVVRGMRVSGGWPVVVSEEQLAAAHRLAGPGVSATGAAGLAGVLALPGDEATAVLFTGAQTPPQADRRDLA
jgi:threonine synthase